MNDFPEMMTVEQASAFLQCSTRNIYDRLRSGTLPALKVGREWRISKSEVIAMTRENLRKRDEYK
ncbi:MAG: helix-turn-helix domain-containing protein [Armatimonadota bacterium]